MADHHIGLDIGSFGVRAAEVTVEGGAAVLHRFAQVTLPPRAVVEGEIADPAVVAASIRDLWVKGGFKSNRVIVGVSTHCEADLEAAKKQLQSLEAEQMEKLKQIANRLQSRISTLEQIKKP